MKDDENVGNDPLNSSAVWWRLRRRRYNAGLVIAGITAFVVYCIVLAIFRSTIPDGEVTIFTILFQAVAYLLCMGLANLL